MARRSDGSVVAWGRNVYGKCDFPAPPSGQTYAGIAAGPGVTAAITREEPGAVSYCPPTPNSTGCAATILALGSASVSANELVLRSHCVPEGVFFFLQGSARKELPFGNGNLCVGGDLARVLPPGVASGGVAETTVDLPAAGLATPGRRYFQRWFRDPAAGGAGMDTSDALAILFVP